MKQILLDREYTDESLLDLESHIEDVLDKVPVDESGFRNGTFRVVIEYRDE